MFRNREIAKTIEFNFIIVIRVIVLPSYGDNGDKYWTKSYTKLADDVPLSIRSNERRFRNVFCLFFHINLSFNISVILRFFLRFKIIGNFSKIF